MSVFIVRKKEAVLNIAIFGAAGFIGTNLTIKLAQEPANHIKIIDKEKGFFRHIEDRYLTNVEVCVADLNADMSFNKFLENQDIVYHLVSTTVPTTSNKNISQELSMNIGFSVNLLEACVHCNVSKVVFVSSGGTVYGRNAVCPIPEETILNPINAYGLQKVTVEKLLYLYHYMYGLDYRVIRFANPYGPFQRPNGIQGVVTTFTYRVIKNETIFVYGDGSVVRDYIYIDDAVDAMLNVVNGAAPDKIFNIGCGYGTSINDVLDIIKNITGKKLHVVYMPERAVDVPENYLDLSRYEKYYGRLNCRSLESGISKTAKFLQQHYMDYHGECRNEDS